jgi:ATP-dependent DNA helicase RecG
VKELHLTEGRNTGFKKILDALRQNGSPLPEFETNEAHDYFIARLFVREGFYDYESGNTSGTTKETTSNVSGTTKETTKETTREILISAIRKNPSITVKELAALVGLTVDGVRYHIDKLRQEGILSREGSTKSGRWIIRP